MLQKFISIVMFIINGTTALHALLALYHKEGTINTYQLKVNQFEPNVVSVHMTLLSEEVPLLVYHFWSIFLIHFSGSHLPSVNWCSLAHFIHSFTGDAPFGCGGCSLWSWGDAPFGHWGRSLRSRGDAPFGRWGTLPSVTGDAPFGRGGDTPFSRYHSMVCTVVANSFVTNSCSVCWYCELRVCISLRSIQLSLARLE